MKAIDKINGIEKEFDTWDEFKEYINLLECTQETFVVNDRENIVIHPLSSTVPIRSDSIANENLKHLYAIKKAIRDFIEHLDKNESNFDEFQNNMATQIYNPIDVCLDEFYASWTGYILEYEKYISTELADQ